MTSLILATMTWAGFLVGQPAMLFIGLLVLIACAIWHRRSLAHVLVALALAQLSLSVHTHHDLRAIASEFQTRDVVLEATQDGSLLTKVKVVRLQGCSNCLGAAGQYSGQLASGQRISGKLMLRPTFGYGEFVAKGHGKISAAKPQAAGLVRTAFRNSLAGVSGEARALVSGLAIGDTSQLSKDLADKLKELSLTHLNAVSGANCAIVVGAVFWLLGFVSKRRTARVGFSILALAAYVVLVGGGSSVIRAAIMSSIVLLLLARGVWPIAALSLTVEIMLLFDPSYATDYGFTLSVFATAGILVLAPKLAEMLSRRLPKWLALSLSVTIAAQLWCMPVLLSLQGGVPTYAVLANLLAEPVVAPITILGISAAALAVPVPLIASALTWVASWFAQWIVAVTGMLSALPAVTLSWHSGVVGMLLLVVGSSFWFLHRSRKFAAVAIIGVLLFEMVATGSTLVRSQTWLSGDWQLVNCNVGQGDGLVIRSLGKVAVVDVGREPKPIDSCLSQLGISKIDLLVLTHFDADHIAGLPGLLHGRQVTQALITPWPDNRPLVGLTMHLLEQVPRVAKVGIGTSGVLGEVSWQVLSPSPTAVEAQDSNDGSIAMRWESPKWVLYTMADLGERGQQRMVQNFGQYLNHPVAKPLILKVSHHGSADQYPELIEAMHPDIAIISVGLGNSYGHPTQKTLAILKSLNSVILRTDLQGEIGVSSDLHYAVAGGG
jgi:competence protein ComEC